MTLCSSCVMGGQAAWPRGCSSPWPGHHNPVRGQWLPWINYLNFCWRRSKYCLFLLMQISGAWHRFLATLTSEKKSCWPQCPCHRVFNILYKARSTFLEINEVSLVGSRGWSRIRALHFFKGWLQALIDKYRHKQCLDICNPCVLLRYWMKTSQFRNNPSSVFVWTCPSIS